MLCLLSLVFHFIRVCIRPLVLVSEMIKADMILLKLLLRDVGGKKVTSVEENLGSSGLPMARELLF